ncbi:MAG: FliM/FliN family flagellar motor switch protein [Planctomycetota bacterium]|nr:MAG: FliM/FliN family flagellar motor switch protein [Planctomycetota bacterium]
MSIDVQTILRIEVPFVVVLAERKMTVREVCDMVVGTIVELPKQADEELEMRINNRPIGTGTAVKIGENFGVRVGYVGNPTERIKALSQAPEEAPSQEDIDAEALAAALLSGQ